MVFGSFFSLKEQKKRFSNVGKVLTQSFNPFSKVKPTVSKKVPKILKAPLKFLVTKPYTTALGITLGASSVGRSLVKKAAVGTGRALTKTPLRTITTVTTAPIAAGVLIKSKKARKAVVGAASTVTIEEGLRKGGVVAGIIEGDKMSIGKALKTGGKYAAVAAGGAALVGVGAVVTKKILDKKKVPTLDDQPVPEVVKDLPMTPAVVKPAIVKDQPLTPDTVDTKTIPDPFKPRTRRRRIKKKPSVRVSQRVNVNVKQSQNKRYIKTYNY